jgi:Tfp pilus assembly protein PilO
MSKLILLTVLIVLLVFVIILILSGLYIIYRVWTQIEPDDWETEELENAYKSLKEKEAKLVCENENK